MALHPMAEPRFGRILRSLPRPTVSSVEDVAGGCGSGVSDAAAEETLPKMDESQNVAGTRLTCTNPDCDCELQINRPCPHGTTYTCACGHPLEPAS
jgi:hypothetical protein